MHPARSSCVPAARYPWRPGQERSDGVHLLGLRALRALRKGVLDLLVFFQAAVAAGFHRRVMHEHVGVAVIGGYEPEPPYSR
jgi:hypothetical protein